jgi:hypothetical protein
LVVAAVKKPNALDIYLWIFIFSLAMYVIEKSIITPENPTIPYLINLIINVQKIIKKILINNMLKFKITLSK